MTTRSQTFGALQYLCLLNEVVYLPALFFVYFNASGRNFIRFNNLDDFSNVSYELKLGEGCVKF